jgi:serine protease Do
VFKLLAASVLLVSTSVCSFAQASNGQDPSGASGRSPSDALRRDMESARRKVYPALVNITVVTRFFAGGKSQRAPAAGSGVIVTAQGHVITNFHVAGHTTRITCTLTTGETLEAVVVTHDPLTDLSILKLRLDKRENSGAPVPYAKLGDSDKLEVGDYVLAMGNPLQLSSSMTLGVVSNTKRVFTDAVGTEIEGQDLDSGEETGMFTRWIQHDALILPGNSGGPLVNLQGEVVGINELGGSGVGFAIPSKIASEILRQALDHGRVNRGWLGMSVLPVEKLGRKNGALISALMPGGPAAKAGLQPGDILLSLNGAPVNVRFFEEVPLLYQRFAALKAGETASVTYEHGGKAESGQVSVTEMEPQRGEEEEVRDMGVTVRDITGPMALAFRFPDKKGVLLTGLRPGYPFEGALPKMLPGDVVISVDGQPTNDPADFKKKLASCKGREFVVGYRRATESLLSVVKPKEEQETEEGGELPKAWIGIKTQVLTADLAKALKLANDKGFRVTQVYPATEASKAGLQPGDVITTLNGEKLTAFRTQDESDLRRAIEELTIGEKAALGVIRDGKRVNVAVTLEEPPSPIDKAKKTRQKEFEFAARDITPLDRMENRWPKDQKGILVNDVTGGGWAQMAGLRMDDLILAVNGTAVDSVDTLDSQMTKLLTQKPRVIRIFVLRGAQTHFVFLEPDWNKLGTGGL